MTFLGALDHVNGVQSFLVQHDWAGAVGPAIQELQAWIKPESPLLDPTKEVVPAELLGEVHFHLPYQVCMFEFMVSGQAFLMLAVQEEGFMPSAAIYFEHNNKWVLILADEFDRYPVFQYLWFQVLAISVALEAQVATTTLRQPEEKLNRKRLKSGKTPLKAYHVVDLNSRQAPARSAESSGEYKGTVRLHFRRGHYRHYEDRKVWINWMLVGNPDLGFVDKHYRI
jgi:hypothetical protein